MVSHIKFILFKKAMLLISNNISRGDFDTIKGLVHDSSIETIKQNYSRLNAQQKALIAARKEDVQMQTLHMFEKVSPNQDVTFVKIGILFQILPGVVDLLEEAKRNPTAHVEIFKKFQTDLLVADYQLANSFT